MEIKLKDKDIRNEIVKKIEELNNTNVFLNFLGMFISWILHSEAIIMKLGFVVIISSEYWFLPKFCIISSDITNNFLTC